VQRAGQAAGGAGEVESYGGQREPGGVGVEHPGRQVRQGPVLQVDDDLLHDGVGAVGEVAGDGVLAAVGEERVVAVGGEQLALLAAAGAACAWLQALDSAHDKPAGPVLGLAPAGEGSEVDLGDLGVADPALLIVVPDRLGVADRGPSAIGGCAISPRPQRDSSGR
jgi:hypothetical protein